MCISATFKHTSLDFGYMCSSDLFSIDERKSACATITFIVLANISDPENLMRRRASMVLPKFAVRLERQQTWAFALNVSESFWGENGHQQLADGAEAVKSLSPEFMNFPTVLGLKCVIHAGGQRPGVGPSILLPRFRGALGVEL